MPYLSNDYTAVASRSDSFGIQFSPGMQGRKNQDSEVCCPRDYERPLQRLAWRTFKISTAATLTELGRELQ